ncbi:MAG: hypothetical protein JST35_02770 [Armatimonadetes bacterium]|nr:hypothetical protein [Armatimonadota bacterium]
MVHWSQELDDDNERLLRLPLRSSEEVAAMVRPFVDSPNADGPVAAWVLKQMASGSSLEEAIAHDEHAYEALSDPMKTIFLSVYRSLAFVYLATDVLEGVKFQGKWLDVSTAAEQIIRKVDQIAAKEGRNLFRTVEPYEFVDF